MTPTRRDVLLASVAVIAGLGASTVWAQASPPPEASRISAEEAVKLAARGEAVLVDVRQRVAWDGGHAEGAISIPLAEIGQRLGELPKDKLIATYCT